MEHVGTGIRRMKDAMRNHGLEEPEFIETESFFKVIFRANSKENGFNARQKQFLRLADKKEITINEYIDLFGVVRNTATKDLNELVDRNLLEKTNGGKQIYYKKIL